MDFFDNNYGYLSDTTSSSDSTIIASDNDSDDSIFINNAYNDVPDTLYNEDVEHMESDKYHGNFYIGLYKHVEQSGNFLFMASASNNLFLKYSSNQIVDYLKEYSIVPSVSDNIEIMKLYIKNETYYVVLKTHWIKLIQRKWKALFQIYKDNQEKKTQPKNLLYREQNGNFPKELNYRPKINGMLRPLNPEKASK
jgi:hypothetical protein